MIGAILMMAGSGSRMRLNENKIYLPLGDQMIYEYSLKLFLSMGLEVVCVIRKEDMPYLKAYEGKVKIVLGGTTRQESVLQGLKAATSEAVLIHDAARPFLTLEIIQKCVQALQRKNACLVSAPCKDTIYKRDPLKNLNRQDLALAQTPQGGNRQELIYCHQQALKENLVVTDDISLILKYGTSMVELIEGGDFNFKITTQLDYVIAKEMMKNA